MSRGWLRGGLAAIAAALAAVEARAVTIQVDVANVTGVEDGTPAHPYDSIQEGVDHALAGDRVQVAPGIYKETVLMKDDVSVLGSGARTTIIDGTGLSNSVVTFDRTRQSPLLTGFTIRAGHGDQISETGGVPVFAGGGILILDSSPVIYRNVVTQNTITQGYCLGAGIYVRSTSSAPHIVENVISHNVALSGNVPGSGEGGAVYIATKTGSVLLEGNLIESNQAVNGGGIYIDNATSSTVEVRRNVIRYNDAVHGGAVFSRVLGGAVTTIESNLILDNASGGAGAQGAGVYALALATGGFSIVNNSLVDNDAPAGNGGAIWLNDAASNQANVVTNNVIAGNTALHGGGIDHTAFHGTIRRNDFFNNTGGNVYDGGGGAPPPIESLFVDPAFASPAQKNYRLGTSSACIDASFEGAAPDDDLDGLPRPFDGNGDASAVSDLGAYEYPGGEVLGVTFLADGNSLSWQTLAFQSGYNVYRGSLARLKSTGAYTQDPIVEPLAARFCNVLPGQVPFTDTYVPPPGPGVFYLATVVLGGAEGPLGPSSIGLPRPNDEPCP
jgi:hypothetical protein